MKFDNKESEIRKDSIYINELLKKLPKDEAFYRQIEHNLYYYAQKARSCKWWCCFLSVLTVVLPAVVTAVSAMSNITPFLCKLSIAMLSALTSVSAGVIGVFNLREQWISYRTSCERTKLEISKYLSKMEPYNLENEIENEQTFFGNCERVFMSEENTWVGNTRDVT